MINILLIKNQERYFETLMNRVMRLYASYNCQLGLIIINMTKLEKVVIFNADSEPYF